MKKSLNAWTVDGSVGFRDMFASVSGAGFDGIELNVDNPGTAHGLHMQMSDEELKAIKALSDEFSLPVVSISTSLSGGMSGIPAKHEDYKKLLRFQIHAAKILGAGGILTAPGGMGEGITLNDARKATIDFFKGMKAEIEEEGIFVGLENVWNGFFLSPYDMVSMFEEIGSDKIGAYFDAGNMLAFSVSEYWAEVLGKWVGCVHVKDYKRAGGLNSGGTWQDITHGSANWQAIIPALRAGGFDGYLTGEVFKADGSMSWDDYYKKVAGEIATICSY